MTTPPLWKASVTLAKVDAADMTALLELAPPKPQAVLIVEDPFGPDAIVSRQPMLPQPHSMPSGSIVMCPNSPANPAAPRNILPLIINPEPIPVPSVTKKTSCRPRAAPT